jgi:hypothetical protein
MAAVISDTNPITKIQVSHTSGYILFEIEDLASDTSLQPNGWILQSKFHPGVSELFRNMKPHFEGKILVSTPEFKAYAIEYSTCTIPFTISTPSETYYCLTRMQLDKSYIHIVGYLLEGDINTNLIIHSLKMLFPKCAAEAYVEGRSLTETHSVFREKVLTLITSGKYDQDVQKMFLIFDLDETLIVTHENANQFSPYGRYEHSCHIDGNMEVSNDRFAHSIMINPAAASALPMFEKFGTIRFLTAGDRKYGEEIVKKSRARQWTTMDNDMDVCSIPFIAADVFSVRNDPKKALQKSDNILPLVGCLPYLGIDNSTVSWALGTCITRVMNFTSLNRDYNVSWTPVQKMNGYFQFALTRAQEIANAYHTNPLSFKWAIPFLGVTEQYLEEAVRNIENEARKVVKRAEARQAAIEKEAARKMAGTPNEYSELTQWLDVKNRIEDDLKAKAAEKTAQRRAAAVEPPVETSSDVADMFSSADEKASIIHNILERETAQQAIIVAEFKRQQEVIRNYKRKIAKLYV